MSSPSLMWLSYCFMVVTIFFARTCVSATFNCSATRASYIYCLDSSLPSTWYNNNSVIMDGWQMRVFLLYRSATNNPTFYCGFYCSGACDSYTFSVVYVAGNNHGVVWSANKGRPVKANATVHLSEKALVLQDSDGTQVWSSSTNGSIIGMKLNQSGSLDLFNDESGAVWKSTVNRSAIIIPTTPVTKTPPPLAQPPSNTPPPTGGGMNGRIIAIISGSAAAGLICLFILFVLVMRWRRQTTSEEEVEDYIKHVRGMPVRFSYEDLSVATNNFEERLGVGGFGSVFRGVLADGTMIAVKRLDKLSPGMREFLAEVETIGSLHHFNLVRLIGFCAEKSCRLLVYEYMSNGSLDNWIYAKDGISCLDWQTRKKVILDIAKGLTYLHEDCRQRIIHLDIKPQNILLDENFNAKVSDFGLSMLVDRGQSQVTTTMRGTPGYLAPEWRESRITEKVDIYSFGIVLLEVVSARRNIDPSKSESSFQLLKALQTKAHQGKLIDICVDEDVQNYREEVERMIRIGAWCLQDDPKKRPLMSTVVKVLEGVMEVDPNINYKFSHANAMLAPVDFNDYISSAPPLASVLSNPR